MFVLQLRFHLRPSSSAVYHKYRALFLAPFSFSYTSPICSCWLKIVVCIRIIFQTTLRSVGSAHQRRPRARNYRAVLMSFPVGCGHTGPSWTLINWSHLANYSGRRMHQLPQQPVRVGSDLITPVLVVRDLVINIDADASMRCTSCEPRLPVL